MKRLILFLIIGIIGVGIFVLTAQEEETAHEQQVEPQSSEADEVAFFEPSETLIRNIMKDALGARFNAETATYKQEDLDHKGGPELIIGAADQNIATIQVLTILNREGEYERIGKIEYQELLRGAPEFMGLIDIDGDGKDEIIMSLMYGGAASWTEGMFHVDFEKKTMQWVQMQNENGQVQDAIFLLAASATHANVFQILDIDKDGKKEFAEILAQTLFDETQCTTNVYEWNGTLLAFEQNLSTQLRESLGTDCAM